MSDVFKEADGIANTIVNRIKSLPRVDVTRMPKRYRGNNIFGQLLSQPSEYYQNHRYRTLTDRSKALCMNYGHAAAGTRAIIRVEYDDVKEQPWHGKMHVKTTKRSYGYCEKCIRLFYPGIDPTVTVIDLTPFDPKAKRPTRDYPDPVDLDEADDNPEVRV